MTLMTLYHYFLPFLHNSFYQCIGKNVPSPSDSDGEMKASGTSEAPIQGNLVIMHDMFYNVILQIYDIKYYFCRFLC